MEIDLKKTLWILMLLIFPIASFAQKDVTQFLDIPVDGYKPEMIEKLKSRGYTINRQSKDILDGEFNGTNVNIFIGTNNNKVWRIAIRDEYSTDETNIKIRFNSLIQQFVNNNRYSTQSDSIISKFIIPKDEDISYEMTVNNKRYEAVFHQKSIKYDSLSNEKDILLAKDKLSEKEQEKVGDLIVEIFNESMNSLNKPVWFMIEEEYGEYRILMFYENEYNKANGNVL
ncbi:MAG TPA: hypothetical protein ENO27_00045 [Caldithrix sp.]|nr:hypothetical protein [Caldithrix sp.]